ncbi:hypothetical protein IMZ48_39175 [Candidatus Bathyarchaeota archaeon]|nr:hypothetical protein [Candidatus Bathyarchaeota archaeon]
MFRAESTAQERMEHWWRCPGGRSDVVEGSNRDDHERGQEIAAAEECG